MILYILLEYEAFFPVDSRQENKTSLASTVFFIWFDLVNRLCFRSSKTRDEVIMLIIGN